MRHALATLLSTALLGSCGPLHDDIRPEVSQPLAEAIHLSGYWTPNKAAIMAKLNEAASVPNLNSDEQKRIQATAAIIVAKLPPSGQIQNIAGDQMLVPPPAVGYTGLH